MTVTIKMLCASHAEEGGAKAVFGAVKDFV